MRLIDADAVYKNLESCEIKKDTYGSLLNDWDHGYNCGIERGESEIECAPTVDAVPVIRCKDCKYWQYHDEGDFGITYGECNSPQWYHTTSNGIETTGDDYCSRAERKEG